MYILVLEDDPILRVDLIDALAPFAIEIRDAASVDQALRLLAESRPALALLDYHVGADPSTPLAEQLAREDVPFGYVTADADEVRADPRIADCPVVAKPYRADEIVELVGQLLRR